MVATSSASMLPKRFFDGALIDIGGFCIKNQPGILQ
jgi:hypothetical protein